MGSTYKDDILPVADPLDTSLASEHLHLADAALSSAYEASWQFSDEPSPNEFTLLQRHSTRGQSQSLRVCPQATSGKGKGAIVEGRGSESVYKSHTRE